MNFVPSLCYYISAHTGLVNDVSYHLSDKDMFISCSQDGVVLLWDTRKPRPAKVVGKDTFSSCFYGRVSGIWGGGKPTRWLVSYQLISLMSCSGIATIAL